MENINNQNPKSIRPFIGSRDFQESRNFYSDLGFEESIISPAMSLFKFGETGFYLQDAYVKDWIDNTMVFVEVKNVEDFYAVLKSLNFTAKYPSSKLTPIHTEYWGKECFVHDPSGILWHFGEFSGR